MCLRSRLVFEQGESRLCADLRRSAGWKPRVKKRKPPSGKSAWFVRVFGVKLDRLAKDINELRKFEAVDRLVEMMAGG